MSNQIRGGSIINSRYQVYNFIQLKETDFRRTLIINFLYFVYQFFFSTYAIFYAKIIDIFMA